MARESWPSRLFWLILGIALTALAVVFVEPILKDIGGSGPIGDDKRQVRTQAAQTGRYIPFEKSFENSEGSAWLVVLRHSDTLEPLHRSHVADEIRIYQERSTGLELAFHLQPPEIPGDTPTVPTELLFQLRAVRDVTGDDEPEVIGAYYTLAMAPFNPRPIVIHRDSADQPYRATGIGEGPPRLSKHSGAFAVLMHDRYYQPAANIADISSGTFQPARGMEEYAVVGRDPAVLLAAYLAHSNYHADTPTIRIVASILDDSFREIRPYECRQLPNPYFVPEPSRTNQYPRQIRDHWVAAIHASQRRICPLARFGLRQSGAQNENPGPVLSTAAAIARTIREDIIPTLSGRAPDGHPAPSSEGKASH
jgi:hypothetical protein